MEARCPDQAAIAPAKLATGPESKPWGEDFLYQAATVLAILLFLISFWSC